MIDPLAIWKEEATEYNPQSEGQILYQEPADIRRYLQTGSSDSYHLLIGPKGVGKSMLLRQKAYLYQQISGMQNANGDELTENVKIDAQLSVRNIDTFRDVGIWDSIWTFCIYVTVLRHLEIALPEKLDRLLGSGKRLSQILTQVIQYRGEVPKYTGYIKDLSVLINEHVKSGVFLCIDGIDSGFVDLLMNSGKQYSAFEGDSLPHAVQVWVSCQNGAAAAVHSINDHFAHLKILITLRTEAFNALTHHLKANFKAKAVVLRFKQRELKNMFEQKIGLMVDEAVTLPQAADPIVRLVGFNVMNHPYAGTGHDRRHLEEVFNCFYRHTFGRPRELTTIGLRVSNFIKTEEFIDSSTAQRKRLLRYLVHQTAKELLDSYLSEIIPEFDEERLHSFLRTIGKNVFRPEDIDQNDRRLLKYYYNLGLIGRIKEIDVEGKKKTIQDFLPVAQHGFVGKKGLPDSTYLVTHPCLDQLFQQLTQNENYYSRYNIIGHGLEFSPPPADQYTERDWIPQQVSGGRLQKAHGQNQRPLREYYREARSNHILNHQDKMQDFESIFRRRLGLVFRLVVLRNVPLERRAASHQADIDALLADIQGCGLCQHHTARLGPPKDTIAILNFYERLQTRLIVLALVYHTKLSHFHIKQLVATGDFTSRSPPPKGNAHHTYLQKAFFIYGLQKAESRMSVQRYKALRDIRKTLSIVEQRLLDKTPDHLRHLLTSLSHLSAEDRQHWQRTIQEGQRSY